MAILYALAHYDDELFCLGQILDDLSKGKKVVVYHMCGADTDHNNRIRHDIFKNVSELMVSKGQHRLVTINSQNEPLFQNKIYERQSVINTLQNIYNEFGCEKVVTVPADMHPDHRYLNELVKIVFRPDRNNLCDKLLEMHIPGSAIRTDFNYRFSLNEKRIAFMKTIFELYSKHLKGVNTWENYELWLKYNGSRLNTLGAETYNLVYMID